MTYNIAQYSGLLSQYKNRRK